MLHLSSNERAKQDLEARHVDSLHLQGAHCPDVGKDVQVSKTDKHNPHCKSRSCTCNMVSDGCQCHTSQVQVLVIS